MIRKIGLALLASTTILWPSQALAMPMFIGGLVLPFIVSSPLFFLGPAAISAIAMGIGYAAVIGASLLLQYALRPQQPRPEDVQTNFRQPTPVRSALYGEGLLGGPWIFAASKDNYFHRIIALSSRPLSAIDGVWVDDIPDVSFTAGILSGGGDVTTAPYNANNLVWVDARLGIPTETHYASLEALVPEWTPEHRGDGVASIYTRFRGPKAEDIQKYFPNGINTLIRARCRGVSLWNPVDATTSYSDNAARVILDYLRNADGFRMPDSMILTPKALEGWREAAQDCADAIPLAAGGTEPRYRIWGTYQFNERPADVLTRFMQVCNGRIKPVSDGGFTLEVGKWRAPEITIDETMITGFEGLSRGREIMRTANVVHGQFTSAEHEYQSTDAQPWIDAADVVERGEIPIAMEYLNAPSHGQCRRLQKIEARRANPADVGTFVCNKKAVVAYGERFISINFPEMEVVGTFEVMDFQFLFGEHGTLKGCKLTVQSIAASAYAWNAALEEGTPGGVENPPAENPFAAPSGFNVTMQAGGDAVAVWDEPASAAFTVAHIEYENLTNPAGNEEIFAAAEDGGTTITGFVAGDEIRFRMRLQATFSSTSWTAWVTRTALA